MKTFFRATALVSAFALTLTATPVAIADIPASPIQWNAPGNKVSLTPVGQYQTGLFLESASEVVDFHAASKRTAVVNAQSGKVDVLDSSDPANPTLIHSVSAMGVSIDGAGTIPAGAEINSVAVRTDGLAVAAVAHPVKQNNGWLMFFDITGDGSALGAVTVGALPDAVKIAKNGSVAVVANEGEPSGDYSVDPEGTISVITLPKDVMAAGQSAVKTANFHAFESNLPAGVRVNGGRADAGLAPSAYPVSEVLEPEYPTISADGKTAWVSLQENNAFAIVDIATATVTKLVPLGTQDHSKVAIDASNKDDKINRQTWPVQGFFQPDTIDNVEIGGATYILSANEGDARDYDAYSEEARVKDLGKDGLKPLCDDFDLKGAVDMDGNPHTLETLVKSENLGRLKITTADGLNSAGTCYETLYSYGSRSVTIWDAEGNWVWDSADAFETISEAAMPDNFNANGDFESFDSRSDDKGPEPEALAVGKIGSRTYAFVGFERSSGIAVVDITTPTASKVLYYINNRDFAVDPEADLAKAGDIGPESLRFVDAASSPNGAPLLIAGNEVSGTTTYYTINAPLSGTGSLDGMFGSAGSSGSLGS